MGRALKYLIFFLMTVSFLFAQPSWLNDQNLDGYITGVGLSNDSNSVSKRIIATVSARENLAETVKVEIKSYYKMIGKSYNDTHSTVMESIIEQKANELLVGSFVKDTFESSDGTLYVLVAIKKNDLK